MISSNSNMFVCLSYKDIDYLILQSSVLTSIYINPLNRILENDKEYILFNKDKILCKNFFSMFYGSQIEENKAINALVFNAETIPNIESVFTKKQNFALLTTSDSKVLTIPNNEFVLIKGEIGEILQSKGISAVRFINNRIQYFIDLEIFIKKSWRRND